MAQNTRRRGADLADALLTATLAELVAVGYSQLSMEGVAARAHTGKAALYRRWPNKHDLVLAALRQALPPLPEPDTRRSARDNLRAVLTALRDVLARPAPFPFISIIGEVTHDPALRTMFADEIVAPRLAVIESILRHGTKTGEIDPASLTPLTAQTGPALVLLTVLRTGKPPSRKDIEVVIDTMLVTGSGR